MHRHKQAGAEQAFLADERSDLRSPGGRPAPQDPILVIDARDGIREFVARVLATVGHPTQTAADAGAALVLLQQVQPSLILVSGHAQPSGGIPFLTRYHRLPPPHAPVIIFAASAHAAARAVGLHAGAWERRRCSLEEVLAVIKATAAERTTLPTSVALDPSGSVAVLAWDDGSVPCWLVAGDREDPNSGGAPHDVRTAESCDGPSRLTA